MKIYIVDLEGDIGALLWYDTGQIGYLLVDGEWKRYDPMELAHNGRVLASGTDLKALLPDAPPLPTGWGRQSTAR